jgi:hypothetical protein
MATRYSNIGGQIQIYLGNGASRQPTAQELRAFQMNPTAFDVYGPGNRLISGPSTKTAAPAPAPAPAATAARPAAPVVRATPAPAPITPTPAPAPMTAASAPAATQSGMMALRQPPINTSNYYISPANPFANIVPANYRTPESYAQTMTANVPRLNLSPFAFMGRPQSLQIFPMGGFQPTAAPAAFQSSPMTAAMRPQFDWGFKGGSV